MWFVAGLGNPGKKYINTRHNVGFDILDKVVKDYNFKLMKKDKLKEIYKGFIGKQSCIILKPLTYMNLVGPTINENIKFYKVKKTNVLIIHDDIDLKVGKVKIKIGGGNAGHNGLLSIDKSMGSEYKRLRIGVGHPGVKDRVSSFVLNKFKNEERKIIDKIIDEICEKISLIFFEDSLFLTKLALKNK